MTAPPAPAGSLLSWAPGRLPVFIGLILLASLQNGSEALIPWVIGLAVSAALGPATALAAVALLLAGLVVVSIGSSVARFYLSSRLKLDVSFELRRRLGERAARPVPPPLSVVSAGDLATSLTADTNRIGSYPNAAARFIGALVALLVVAVYLLMSSVTLGLAVLAGVPLIMLATARIAVPLERQHGEHRRLLGELGDYGADLGLGLRILRGLGAEQEFARRYRKTSAAARAAGVAVGRSQAALEAARVLLPGLFLVFVIWLGARLALAGRITPGELVAFYAAAAFLVEPVNSTASFARVHAAAVVAARNVRAALETPRPADRLADGQDDSQDLRGDIAERRTGLRLGATELTAVLLAPGTDAAGLAEHLAGLRDDHDRWDVVVGEQAISGFGRARLRRSIVFQEPSPVLFSGSFRSVLDPSGEASDAELRDALQVAVADELVQRLPAGLGTLIGPDGREFSGGQRQRVALARSLLRDSPYLILMDPTGALDSATEIEVVRRLRAARAGRATVVFSRSLPWLELADRVVFLAEEPASGTHRELLAGNEHYRRLVRSERQECDA